MRTWEDHCGFRHMIIETEEEADNVRRFVADLEGFPADLRTDRWNVVEALRNYDEANQRFDEALRPWKEAGSPTVSNG